MSLENVTGKNLLDAYKKIQPGTMLHADELMKEKVNVERDLKGNSDLIFRARNFYTADGIIYYLSDKGKTPMLAITREKYNPVLQHIDEAFPELLAGRCYRPPMEDVQKALRARSTVKVDLNKASVFNLSSEEYQHKNFIGRIYGKGDDFLSVMKMLLDEGLGDSNFWGTEIIRPLNAEYVREHAQDGPFAHASLLYGLEHSWWSSNHKFPNFWAGATGPELKLFVWNVRGILR